MNKKPPSVFIRILSVWKRHQQCYFKHLIANGLPPFMEPVLFIFAIGFGLGKYIDKIEGMNFAAYIAPAMMATSSFYTASFETTFGTFIRMEYQKTYQNILSSPVTFRDIYWGELFWCGTKGFVFSLCVLLVISLFGLVKYPYALLTPFIGFVNAVVFGMLGFFVTGFVKDINNFNIYFTGILTPMFFFSETFFPVSSMPAFMQNIANFIPLRHCVVLMRSLSNNIFDCSLLYNFIMLIVLAIPFGVYSYFKLQRRMIV
ncbi:MAG: ABC-type Nod factor export system, permease [uncultured bacterium]|nr:MAG: ABC-type Nod factor export system, permease [uncultured bacterium]